MHETSESTFSNEHRCCRPGEPSNGAARIAFDQNGAGDDLRRDTLREQGVQGNPVNGGVDGVDGRCPPASKCHRVAVS